VSTLLVKSIAERLTLLKSFSIFPQAGASPHSLLLTCCCFPRNNLMHGQAGYDNTAI
jgi:hypothetical protein